MVELTLKDIVIDPEFEKLIPKMRDQELLALEEQLIKDGCRDALCVWDSNHDGKCLLLIDGHHRYAIIKKLEDKKAIPYKVEVIYGIESRLDARKWILDNQLGRRNLTESQYSVLRGQRLEAEKQDKEDNLKQNLSKHHGDASGDESDEVDEDAGKTAKQIGDKTGVSQATIERDEAFQDIETIKESALIYYTYCKTIKKAK